MKEAIIVLIITVPLLSYLLYRVLKQDRIEKELATKSARLESELNLATDIQANMLPNIFPAIPHHSDAFNIYATMDPAKEVGGDFYDFFMIDDSRIALVIGDVSGKGVPAALFMVTTTTLIKDQLLGLSPSAALTKVNTILCEGNRAGLFVTAWVGVFDYQTGDLTYVNAGHNPPLLLQNGKYEYLEQKRNLVLAALDGFRYKSSKLHLEPGDKLFIYTDGVTEATSEKKELYGEPRLKDYLNAHKDDTEEDLLKGLRKDIDKFVGSAEQFDDITMLAFNYKSTGSKEFETRVYEADSEGMQASLGYIEEFLDMHDAPIKCITQIVIAAEELITNIVKYSYPRRKGRFKVSLNVTDNKFTMYLKDSGIRFNPLLLKDPDVTLSAEDRKIGGLGIFMVKKTMSSFDYEFTDQMNIVKITKEW